MRISGFHIDGFGIYHDQGVLDLPPGLVLFIGENEGGKTTLMEFLRTMLFGAPRGGKKRNEYLPLRGGNPGGRLQVIMQDGRRFTIARSGKQATLAADGSPPTRGEPGEQLLGGLDLNTFKQVFAVGLDDLQGLEILSQEGVRTRLLAASAGLGAASVPEVMKNLDREMDSLLAPRALKQINQLVRRLQETEADLRELRGQAAAYAGKQHRSEELEEHIRGHRGQAEDIRQQLRRLDQLDQARQPWVNRNRAQEQARELDYVRDFPPRGLERFEHLAEELANLSQKKKAREAEVVRLEQELTGLILNEDLLRHQAAIESLAGERERLVSARRDFPPVRARLDQEEEEFRRKLRDLGPDWDAERLARVDTSVQVRQVVQEFGRRLESAERQYESALARQQAQQEAATEAQRRAEAAQEQLQQLPPPPIRDARELQQQQEAVRRLRSWLHYRDLEAAQLQARSAAREEAQARTASLQRQLEEPGAVLPWWLSLPPLLLGLGLGGWWTYQQDYVPAGVMYGLGVGVAALLLLLHRAQRRQEVRRQVRLREELEQVEEAHFPLAGEIAELEERLRHAAQEMREAAGILQRQEPADLRELEVIAGELDQAEARWRQRQAQEQDTVRAQTQWDEANARLARCRQDTEEAARDRQRLQEEWANWLAPRGFAEAIRPEGFAAVLQAVENAREAARNLTEYRRRVEVMAEYLATVRAQIGQLLAACGLTPATPDGGVEDLDTLRRALSTALARQQQQKELERRKTVAGADLGDLSQQEQEKAAALAALLQQAGAADDTEFRQRAAAYEDWRGYRQKIDDAEIALNTLAGTPEAQAALELELAHSDPLELQAEKERLQDCLQELETAMTQDNREVGSLRSALNALAQDQELGRLLFAERSLKEQLGDAIRRWATLAVCRHLLEQARGVYERERQPQVIREADGFLGTMVQGRYRLVASVGEDSLHLEDRSLGRKDQTCWSAGLADQVYLAIRLGLAREFGRHSEPLPVILDDVLVKFDPRRRLNAVRVILEFARDQQVLLFSCHPEFLEAVQRVHHEPRYQETPVASFLIRDGVISRSPLQVA
jgi:uncharacterized protein YhaN